jgi:XTP/dITP diphosphohydrolase
MKLLFGTTNQSKRDRFRNLLSGLDLEILSLLDMGIDSSVEEDGNNAEENTIKKVKYYRSLSGIPTFSIDYALRLEKFSEEVQPNTHVRRINKDNKEASDDELLDWFIVQLNKVGGESKGIWFSAIALVDKEGRLSTAVFETETLFLSKPSKVMMKGEPLNSLQFDTKQGKYKSERTPEEWIDSNNIWNTQIIDFFRKNLNL